MGGKALYRLSYPNRELRQSLNEYLLRNLVQDVTRQTVNSMRLARLLAAHDCAGLEELFRWQAAPAESQIAGRGLTEALLIPRHEPRSPSRR